MVPQSILSFAHNVAEIAAYRDELHHDIRQAFDRFGVNLDMMKKLPGDPAKRLRDVKRAGFEIERAAYEGRTNPGGAPRLQVPMRTATKNLFEHAAPFLALEIQIGAPGPDQPLPSAGTPISLLRAVYLLFYCSAYRLATPFPPNSLQPIPGFDALAFRTAWTAVRDALLLPLDSRPSAPSVEPHLLVLMRGLAEEFAAFLWIVFCW